MMTKSPKGQSRVPSTRFGRFARLGLAAGELALGGVSEGLRGLGRGGNRDAGELFLTERSATKLAARLGDMRGAAMKMGQLMSMESADLLPRQFAQALAALRGAAHTMPGPQLRRVLEREYGRGWERRFAQFDYSAIAAASIGQVHRATTLDGRHLALKIQYPGVSKSIASDIDNLAVLLRLARLLPRDLDISVLLAEAKQQFQREADYCLEADYLKLYARLLQTATSSSCRACIGISRPDRFWPWIISRAYRWTPLPTTAPARPSAIESPGLCCNCCFANCSNFAPCNPTPISPTTCTCRRTAASRCWTLVPR